MRNNPLTLFDLAIRLHPDLWDSGHYSLCEAHTSTVRSVHHFCAGTYPLLKDVFTKDFLRRYQLHLMLSGRKRNTISYYMSILRSLYYVAVDHYRLKHIPNLFSDVFTGNDPTEKRAVEPGIVGILATADLSDRPRLERCRDYFVLSFMLQGMPFVDLAHLRKQDLQGDIVVYRRHKTGTVITAPLSESIRIIFDRYAAEAADSPYVLPILDPQAQNPHCYYKSALRKQNRQLEALADYLEIEGRLTTYVARHSWATIAHHNDVSMGVVSQAMGHRTEEVTRIYLSTFDKNRLKEANRKVMNAVLQPVLDKKLCSADRLNALGLKLEKVEKNIHSTVEQEVLARLSQLETFVYKPTERAIRGDKKCPSTRD